MAANTTLAKKAAHFVSIRAFNALYMPARNTYSSIKGAKITAETQNNTLNSAPLDCENNTTASCSFSEILSPNLRNNTKNSTQITDTNKIIGNTQPNFCNPNKTKRLDEASWQGNLKYFFTQQRKNIINNCDTNTDNTNKFGSFISKLISAFFKKKETIGGKNAINAKITTKNNQNDLVESTNGSREVCID